MKPRKLHVSPRYQVMPQKMIGAPRGWSPYKPLQKAGSATWHFEHQARKNAIAAGLHLFVAAELTKAPMCALKLGDRTFLTGVPRGYPAGIRPPRNSSATVPPVRFWVNPGRVFSLQV
jgi:hypothetical protein